MSEQEQAGPAGGPDRDERDQDEGPRPAGAADAGERQRLYFHVGLPKSGSTYLQTVLGTHRAALREHDHVYPFVGREGMFHAAVEMAGTPARWGLDPVEIEGTFAHLLRRGRRLGGTVVLSHEIFGAATQEQVDVMAPLLRDFDLHVVVTARDLGRSVTAVWQEEVKNGRVRTFAEFSGGLLDDGAAVPATGVTFWRSQHLMNVLARWGALVPADHVHVVPCPPAGTAPALLWERFAEAVDLPADAVDLTQIPTRNESLGAPQVTFLREVLEEVDDRLEQPWHARVAKRWFAQTLLGAVPSAKPVAPAELTEQLAEIAAAWVEEVRSAGYRVHGDLQDLVPRSADPAAPHPDDVRAEDVLAGLPGVVAQMLVTVRGLHEELAASRADGDGLLTERDRLRVRVTALEAAAAEPPPAPVGRFPWVPPRVRALRYLGRRRTSAG